MWYLDTLRIFVTDFKTNRKQVIAKLVPIDSISVYHVFGYESPDLALSAYVVSNGSLNDLMDLGITGLTYTLSGPEGVVGDFIVNDVAANRTKSVYQTIDYTKSITSPVYVVDISLSQDES